MKKVAVILSGSGVFDGAELHEAVLTLLAIEQCGGSYQCFAPDKPQLHVVNHLTSEVSEGETRNVLVESARIARGDIKPVTECHVEDFDALILPGGFGAAKICARLPWRGKIVNPIKKYYAFVRRLPTRKSRRGMRVLRRH